MRKSLHALLALGCVALGLVLPADPAEATEPPLIPSNVTIAWDSVADWTLAVQWSGAVPGTQGSYSIFIVDQNGTKVFGTDAGAGTGRPNRIVYSLHNFTLPTGRKLRVEVLGCTSLACDEPATPKAFSPVFDADRPPPAHLDSIAPRLDGTILLSWHAPVAVPDSTPNDPLDRPQPALDTRPFMVNLSIGQVEPPVVIPPYGSATTAVLRAPLGPMEITVVTKPNEWPGQTYSNEIYVAQSKVTIAHASNSPHASSTTITGLARQRPAADSGISPILAVDPGRNVTLQSRGGSIQPWRPLQATVTRADGTFRFTVTTPGTRDYRVVETPITGTGARTGKMGAITAAVAITLDQPYPASGGSGSGSGSDGGSGAGSSGGLPPAAPPTTATAPTTAPPSAPATGLSGDGSSAPTGSVAPSGDGGGPNASISATDAAAISSSGGSDTVWIIVALIVVAVALGSGLLWWRRRPAD